MFGRKSEEPVLLFSAFISRCLETSADILGLLFIQGLPGCLHLSCPYFGSVGARGGRSVYGVGL